MWTALRGVFGSTGAPEQTIGVQYNAPWSLTNDKAAEVSFDTAMQVSAAWACIRIISETIASLPFDIFDTQSDKQTPAESLRLRTILKQKPNSFQTPVEFWESVLLNLVTSGNSYCVIDRLRSGQMVGLRPLSSQQVETELLSDGAIVHRYTSGNVTRVYSQESIWHLKLFGNGLVGMSPLSHATGTVAIAQAAENRVNKIYSNGAKPSGVLMIDRTLKPEQRAQIRTAFKDLSEGEDDRLFVLEADMKYEQVSMSPQDIELLQSRRFQIEDIGRFFGVPSILMNQTEGQSSLGSNVYEIMQAFYKLTLRPYLEKIESSISRWLINDPRYKPEFDFDALLRADALRRAQALREMINSAQITPNEARAIEGRGPIAGGDSLMIQGAMVPIQEAGNNGEGNEDEADTATGGPGQNGGGEPPV